MEEIFLYKEILQADEDQDCKGVSHMIHGHKQKRRLLAKMARRASQVFHDFNIVYPQRHKKGACNKQSTLHAQIEFFCGGG